MSFSNKIIKKIFLPKPEQICNLPAVSKKGENMKKFTVMLILTVIFAQSLFSQFAVDAENGMIGTTYNNIRVPGDTGTKFSLCDELEDDIQYFYRLRLNYTLKEKHFFSLLYAPLTIESSGRFDKDVNYRDAVFFSGTDIEASYTFNSYRLTYRYEWINNKNFEFGIGFTAKIRDAEIELKNEDDSAGKSNIGFVPIINFRAMYKYNEVFGLLVEGDALAAPQGRAEDVLAALTWNYNEKLLLKAGYRILEGGADNDEVYTFSLINYAVLGFIYTF
jgi:hypothetical protein